MPCIGAYVFTLYVYKYHKYLVDITKDVAAKIGAEAHPGEPEVDGLLRGLLTSVLVVPNSPFQDAFERHYNALKEKVNAGDVDGGVVAIPANLRRAVLKYGSRFHGTEGYNIALEVVKKAVAKENQINGILALGASRDEELLKRTSQVKRSAQMSAKRENN